MINLPFSRNKVKGITEGTSGLPGGRVERGGFNLNDLLRPYVPYLPVGFSVVFGILIFLFVALSRISQFPSVSAEIADNQNKLVTLKDKDVRLVDLLNHQEVLESDLSVVDAALPDKESVPELLAEIEKIASESGVSIRALHFGIGSSADTGRTSAKPVIVSKYSTVQLQADADGSFANLGSFLTNIENASRLIFVDNLRFNQETVRETPRVRVSLALSSFYVILPDSPALTRPVTLNLNSPDLSNVLKKLKLLRIYKIDIGTGGAGRLNPFE